MLIKYQGNKRGNFAMERAVHNCIFSSIKVDESIEQIEMKYLSQHFFSVICESKLERSV